MLFCTKFCLQRHRWWELELSLLSDLMRDLSLPTYSDLLKWVIVGCYPLTYQKKKMYFPIVYWFIYTFNLMIKFAGLWDFPYPPPTRPPPCCYPPCYQDGVVLSQRPLRPASCHSGAFWRHACLPVATVPPHKSKLPFALLTCILHFFFCLMRSKEKGVLKFVHCWYRCFLLCYFLPSFLCFILSFSKNLSVFSHGWCALADFVFFV